MLVGKSIDKLNNPEYTLIKSNLKFKIYYGGNLDLYWEIENTDVTFDNFQDYEEKPLEFRITEDDGEVYSVFSELYSGFMGAARELDSEEKKKEKEKMDATDQIVYVDDQKEVSLTELLVKNGAVVWHSDDDVEYDDANFVTITPFTGDILITFRKGPVDDNIPGTISIRIRNNGSRYQPFNMYFMKHFDQMKNVATISEEVEPEQHKRKLTNN